MQSVIQAKQRVLKLQHLPPLSATATRLLGMLGDENLSLEDLAHVISQDPGLSARILGLANSAYFGQTNPILSIEDAVIRVLGLNMVKSLAFSIAVCGVFESSSCSSFDLKSYWSHSLSIAMLSRQIGLAVDGEQQLNADSIYLAGLLFDLGVMVLVHEFPEEYSRVLLRSKQQSSQELSELEMELIGMDHRQAGAWLAYRWHLPEIIVQIIAQAGEAHKNEILLVGTVAEWVKRGLESSEGVVEIPSTLRGCCGLSLEKLETILARFIGKSDEIRVIANMLAMK